MIKYIIYNIVFLFLIFPYKLMARIDIEASYLYNDKVYLDSLSTEDSKETKENTEIKEDNKNKSDIKSHNLIQKIISISLKNKKTG